MSPGDKFTCCLATCGKNITKSQGSISCKLCQRWYHANCVGISQEQLEVISKSKGILASQTALVKITLKSTIISPCCLEN